MSVTIRRATAEDLKAFAPTKHFPTVKAWVGEVDGRIVGIGGLALSCGRWFAFADIPEEARAHRRAIVRVGRLVMADAKAMGLPFVYAEADPEEPMSMKWLRSLGFEIDERSGFLMKWRASHG